MQPTDLPAVESAPFFIVCYLDLLGYGELISKLVKDKQLSESFENTLGKQLVSMDAYKTLLMGGNFSDINKRTMERITFRLVSDSVLITMPLTEWFEPSKTPSLEECVVTIEAFLSGVSMFCIGVTTRIGYFFRGGVSLGHHYESCPTPEKPQNLFVLSPTLVDAVRLEREVADTPRIVVGKSVLTFIEAIYKKEPDPLQKDGWTFRDFTLDGQVCLNLYNLPIRKLATHRDVDGAARRFLEIMRDILSTWIAKTKNAPQLLKKYLWFAAYHNREVDKLNDPTLRVDSPGLLTNTPERCQAPEGQAGIDERTE